MDGVRGVADGGVDLPPLVVVQLSEVATLRAEDLRELADVELAGARAGGGADPEPVPRQTVRCGGAVEQVRRRRGDLGLGSRVTAAGGQQLPGVIPRLLAERHRAARRCFQVAVSQPPWWWLRIQPP